MFVWCSFDVRFLVFQLGLKKVGWCGPPFAAAWGAPLGPPGVVSGRGARPIGVGSFLCLWRVGLRPMHSEAKFLCWGLLPTPAWGSTTLWAPRPLLGSSRWAGGLWADGARLSLDGCSPPPLCGVSAPALGAGGGRNFCGSRFSYTQWVASDKVGSTLTAQLG